MMQSWMINLYSVDDACKLHFLKKILDIHFLLKYYSPISVLCWCELHYFNGLVQEFSNSIANALELCTKPSTFALTWLMQ